ncbi:MAG: hypothetical protein ACOH2Q_18635, partial [Rhodococcus sp. (in: high G+C Gram-positive bacteria)]
MSTFSRQTGWVFGSVGAAALSLFVLVSGCTIATEDDTTSGTSRTSEATPASPSVAPTSDAGTWTTAVPV